MATKSVSLKPETGPDLCRVNLKDSFGGYKNEILTENLSDREKRTYNCPRCNGIMKDASLSNSGEPLCAWCKREGEQPILNAHVKNIIISLKCACPLSKRGCKWLGTIENVENHLTTCGHVYDSCELSCGVVLTRDQLKSHMREECQQREKKCIHCEVVHKVCKMVDHVKVCGKILVICGKGCGLRVRRENLTHHKASGCDQERPKSPLEAYMREVVQTKQQLEGNKSLLIELKLDALEEQNWKLSKQVETLQSDMRNKDKEIELLTKKVATLEHINIRNVLTVKWTIKDVNNKSNPQMAYSDEYEIAGYRFQLRHSNEDQNLNIDFRSIRGTSTDLLEWPFRTSFTTRMVCHRDPKRSLLYKSTIITIQKGEYRFGFLSHKRIASIPLSTDLEDFIQLDCLELEITILILKSK